MLLIGDNGPHSRPPGSWARAEPDAGAAQVTPPIVWGPIKQVATPGRGRGGGGAAIVLGIKPLQYSTQLTGAGPWSPRARWAFYEETD